MGKRRPNVVCPTPYLEECLAKVHDHEETGDSKYTLVYWVKLQVLTDELSTQLLQNEVASVSEAKARTVYKNFERQMKDWEGARNGHLPSCKWFLHSATAYIMNFRNVEIKLTPLKRN